jgi:hypothetical protein
MKLDNIDGFSFDFPDAIAAFKFDETDSSKPTFHKAPMKCVDMVVELREAYLFVEIKNYDDPADFDIRSFTDEEQSKKKRGGFSWLKNYLKYKYRDSYLFRCAEEKVDKPIHYICLINFENALNSIMQKELKRELPVGKASGRWKHEIANSCQVLTVEKWGAVFPGWPVAKAGA